MLSRNFLKFNRNFANTPTNVQLNPIYNSYYTKVQKRIKSYAEVLNLEELDPTQKEKRMEKYRIIIDEQVRFSVFRLCQFLTPR
jgi:hypothetical protein